MKTLEDDERPRPGALVELAGESEEQVGPGGTATDEDWVAAFDRALAVARDELRAIWTGISTGQRRVLTTIAENAEGLYAGGRRHGGSRGGAVKSAVAALCDLGEVAPDPSTATGHRVVDPLLRYWIAVGRPGA